jgi:hypothetical protein
MQLYEKGARSTGVWDYLLVHGHGEQICALSGGHGVDRFHVSADNEDDAYTASGSTYSTSPRMRRSAGSKFSACLTEIRRSPALVRTLTICSDSSRRSCWFRPTAVCPVSLIVRHGQRAELRCLRYLRRPGRRPASQIARQADAPLVLSVQVKGAVPHLGETPAQDASD